MSSFLLSIMVPVHFVKMHAARTQYEISMTTERILRAIVQTGFR